MDDDEKRRLLSTAFEPNDDGFFYYRNRWSGGVPVTAEEREAFISAKGLEAISLGREFSKRPAITPPRRVSSWLVADAMPRALVVAYATTALGAAGLANQVESPIGSSVLWAVAGLLGLAFIVLTTRRHFRSRR